MSLGYLVIFGIFALLSSLVSKRLKAKFKKYSQVRLSNGLSGKEIAERMLAAHGIVNVKITQVAGSLTDHYNPVNRTVNLSESVYFGKNAASAAVSAHECGHAVQHATAYSMLSLRSKLVPIQNISGRILNIVIFFGGFLGVGMNSGVLGLTIIVACYAVLTLFSLVTLPVEFDASKRALVWMETHAIVNEQELAGAKDALKWAALTYVVAALASAVTFLYFLFRLMNNRR